MEDYGGAYDDIAHANDDVKSDDDESLPLGVDEAPHSCGDGGPQGELLLLGHLLCSCLTRQVLQICDSRCFGFVSDGLLYFPKGA